MTCHEYHSNKLYQLSWVKDLLITITKSLLIVMGKVSYCLPYHLPLCDRFIQHQVLGSAQNDINKHNRKVKHTMTCVESIQSTTLLCCLAQLRLVNNCRCLTLNVCWTDTCLWFHWYPCEGRLRPYWPSGSNQQPTSVPLVGQEKPPATPTVMAMVLPKRLAQECANSGQQLQEDSHGSAQQILQKCAMVGSGYAQVKSSNCIASILACIVFKLQTTGYATLRAFYYHIHTKNLLPYSQQNLLTFTPRTFYHIHTKNLLPYSHQEFSTIFKPRTFYHIHTKNLLPYSHQEPSIIFTPRTY